MGLKACAWVQISCLALVACCLGAESDTDAEQEPSFYVGMGAIVSSKPYVGTEARVYPVPLFGYEGKRVYLRGIVGGYRLYSHAGFSIGPVVQPRFDGYEDDDSSRLKGMDDRDWSVDAGVGAAFQSSIGLFGLSYVTDLLGRHDGQELELSYTIRFPLAGFDIIPSAGVRWKSRNLVDYYYGVELDEVILPGRPPYDADSAVDPFLRLVARRTLSQRWNLLAAFQYEWLDDEIADSPIVDDDYDISLMFGLMYTW